MICGFGFLFGEWQPAGQHNNINVLDHSQVFGQLLLGRTPTINHSANGHHFSMCYYLTDDTYPRYAVLVQTIAHLAMMKERLFGKKHETTRKASNEHLEGFKLDGESLKALFNTRRKKISA